MFILSSQSNNGTHYPRKQGISSGRAGKKALKDAARRNANGNGKDGNQKRNASALQDMEYFDQKFANISLLSSGGKKKGILKNTKDVEDEDGSEGETFYSEPPKRTK